MPNLNDIATNINTALLTGPFVKNLFKPAAFYGIAELIKTVESDKEFFQPLYLDNYGEGTSMAFDDTNAIQAYHRIENITYRDDPEAYGSEVTMEETANMRFVFFGQRNKVLTRPENILASIQLYFEKEFSPATLTALSLTGCVIEMGDVNMDQYAVWDAEFRGIDYGLAPEVMLFAIPYRITSTYNKTCFTLC